MTDNTKTIMFPMGGVDGEFDPNKVDGRRFTLSRPFRVYMPIYEYDFTVAKEFVTDFNSVPRILWDWFAPWECVEAGVTHDWLYQHPQGMSRWQVDAVHRRIMLATGERRGKSWAAWLGIRLGGWKPWGAYRRQGLK